MRTSLINTLVLFLVYIVEAQYNQCINPQNNRGLCIPYQSCAYLVNILRLYQNNNDALTFAQRSVCGTDSRTQQKYVCCPYNPANRPQPQPQAQDRNFIINGPNRVANGRPTNQQQTTNGQQVQEQATVQLPKCGVDLDNRIYGGMRSSINDFGWLALLRYTTAGSQSPVYKCAGSLINNRYILTAAHCIHPRLLQSSRLIGVRVGEWNLLTDDDCEVVNGRKACAPSFIDVQVEEIIPHEKYFPSSLNQHNDIGLLRLASKIQYNDYIKPICLQSDRNLKIRDILGHSLVVAGFGATEFAASSLSKQHVSIRVVETEVCDQIFRREGRRLSDSQICAGGVKNQDSCKGDSGGPLQKLVSINNELTWVLYGIVSYGTQPCGEENIPGVYTKVDQYIDWITSKLKP